MRRRLGQVDDRPHQVRRRAGRADQRLAGALSSRSCRRRSASKPPTPSSTCTKALSGSARRLSRGFIPTPTDRAAPVSAPSVLAAPTSTPSSRRTIATLAAQPDVDDERLAGGVAGLAGRSTPQSSSSNSINLTAALDCGRATGSLRFVAHADSARGTTRQGERSSQSRDAGDRGRVSSRPARQAETGPDGDRRGTAEPRRSPRHCLRGQAGLGRREGGVSFPGPGSAVTRHAPGAGRRLPRGPRPHSRSSIARCWPTADRALGPLIFPPPAYGEAGGGRGTPGA